MIVLIDYGMGNLGSVAKALAFLGQSVTVSQDPEIVFKADRLILPGVGAMQYVVSRLQDKGLDGAIRQYLTRGRPFLGICLGMQLMFDRSEEGDTPGLGILPGCVRRFPSCPGLKVPHMGWNRLVDSRLQLLPDHESFYFVHSYYVQPDRPDMTAASCSHGIVFAAAVQVGPILLTQFHPEKSGDAGLRLLTHWLAE